MFSYFFYVFNDQTWSTIEVHPTKKDDLASNWNWRIHDQNSSGRSALVSMLIQDDFPAPEALTVILPLLSQSNLLKAALARPSAIFNIISFLHLKETQHYVRSSLVVPPNKKKKQSFVPFHGWFKQKLAKNISNTWGCWKIDSPNPLVYQNCHIFSTSNEESIHFDPVGQIRKIIFQNAGYNYLSHEIQDSHKLFFFYPHSSCLYPIRYPHKVADYIPLKSDVWWINHNISQCLMLKPPFVSIDLWLITLCDGAITIFEYVWCLNHNFESPNPSAATVRLHTNSRSSCKAMRVETIAASWLWTAEGCWGASEIIMPCPAWSNLDIQDL